jgi:hypothetical protein
MYLTTSALDTVVGKFNGAIENKKLVVLDEANSKADPQGYASQIKNLATEKVRTYEHKNLMPTIGYNYACLLVFSNMTKPLHIDVGDRRYVCLQASPDMVGNTAYFKNLADTLLCAAGANGVMHYLMNKDISKFDHRSRPPTTQYKELVQDLSMESHQEFMKNWVAKNHTDKEIIHYEKDELWDDYRDYLISQNAACVSQKTFQKQVMGINGVDDHRIKTDAGKFHRLYKLNLAQMRHDFNLA